MFTGSPQARQAFDSLRVLRIGEDYILSDLLFGAERPALNAISVRASQGLRILGASTNPVAGSTPRQHERSDFHKINFEVSRTQTLFNLTDVGIPWEGASVAVMGLLAGQWTDMLLPSAEQFYLGGARYTRGYYSGQIPADNALADALDNLMPSCGT